MDHFHRLGDDSLKGLSVRLRRASCGLRSYAQSPPSLTRMSRALSLGQVRGRMRYARILTLIAIVSLGTFTVFYLRDPFRRSTVKPHDEGNFYEEIPTIPPPEPLAPKRFENTRVHPIDQLVRDAESSWLRTQRAQSQTLEEAVAEYKRRYRIPPPPNFHIWYQFAKSVNVQLIDEYDNIYHSLLPFWGLAPSTIRARAREAIGSQDNMLMGLSIRDGQPTNVMGGQTWLQGAVVEMMGRFIQYLPDMDLVFNTHDEPRVVVPHDDLTRLVQAALKGDIMAASKRIAPQNHFSVRPDDVNTGKRFGETKLTRFNWYAHQPVWVPSRLSCPPESPARAMDESLAADNLTAYALGDLGFVYNHTSFTDICNSPSLAKTYGFFDRPNAFNIVHDLFPIFSQSKISSFQDILYPSPWYWSSKVAYKEHRDMDWSRKIPSLFWRGSTTGGFSRDGGWRRQHRQHIVQKINALDDAKIIHNSNKDSGKADTTPSFETKEVSREDYKNMMDVHFSHIGQCDPGDCNGQKEYFGLYDSVEQQETWRWRYLLDMDGNAFSGRFYAFLQSKSLVFKMSMFREWHEEWIKPWVHYVPLSLRGEDILESVRYFAGEEEGKQEAVRLAEAGREWAKKALRNEDFEAWFFRVLLEYVQCSSLECF